MCRPNNNYTDIVNTPSTARVVQIGNYKLKVSNGMVCSGDKYLASKSGPPRVFTCKYIVLTVDFIGGGGATAEGFIVPEEESNFVHYFCNCKKIIKDEGDYSKLEEIALQLEIDYEEWRRDRLWLK